MKKILILLTFVLFTINSCFAQTDTAEIKTKLLNQGYENEIIEEYISLINETNYDFAKERIAKNYFNPYFETNLLKLRNEGKDYYKKYDEHVLSDKSVRYNGTFDLSDEIVAQDIFMNNLKFYREIFKGSKYSSWLDSDINYILKRNNYNVVYFPYRDSIMKYYFANGKKDIFKTKEYYELGSFLVGKIDGKNFKFYKNKLVNPNTNYPDLLHLSYSICPVDNIAYDRLDEALEMGCFSKENYERKVESDGSLTCDTYSFQIDNKIKKCMFNKVLAKNNAISNDIIEKISYTDIPTKKVEKIITKNLNNDKISHDEQNEAILSDIKKAQNKKENIDEIKKIPSSIGLGLAGGLGILVFSPAAMFLDSNILEGLSPGGSYKTYNQKITDGLMHLGLVNPISLGFYFIGK